MSQLQARVMRFALDQSSDSAFVDVLGGSKAPWLWQGNDVFMQGGVFLSEPAEATLRTDLSNLNFLTLRIRDTNAAGALLLEKVISVFDSTLTWATWEDRTQQHFQVFLTREETNIPILSGLTRTLWLVFAVTTTDVPARDITLGGTTLTLRSDGIGDAEGFDPSEGIAYTKAEADARFLIAADVPGALVNKVAVPANSAAAGAPGDFAMSATHIYFYTGDGVTHSWVKIAGATAF